MYIKLCMFLLFVEQMIPFC